MIEEEAEDSLKESYKDVYREVYRELYPGNFKLFHGTLFSELERGTILKGKMLLLD